MNSFNLEIYVYRNDMAEPFMVFDSLVKAAEHFGKHRDSIVRLIYKGLYMKVEEDYFYFDWGLRSDNKLCKQIEDDWFRRQTKNLNNSREYRARRKHAPSENV